MPNSGGKSVPPPHRWRWIPSRPRPQPPKSGGTALAGDIPELIHHVQLMRAGGATITEAEQAWVDGMKLINQRAAQFPGNGPVVNDFFGVVGGDWRVYVGRPALLGGDAFAFAFHTGTGTIAWGRLSDIRPHPVRAGELALFNFTILYP